MVSYKTLNIAGWALVSLAVFSVFFSQSQGLVFWPSIIIAALCLGISSFIRSRQTGRSRVKAAAVSIFFFILPFLIAYAVYIAVITSLF